MALSDACFEFVETIRSAALELADAAEWYADGPIPYDSKIDGLRQACADVQRVPLDVEAAVRLIRLAASVLAYYDTMPDDPKLAERQAQMDRLVEILRSDLDEKDVKEVGRIIPDMVNETHRTEGAALKLKRILPKLGKATYDVAVNVISDIASETAKKILGLGP